MSLSPSTLHESVVDTARGEELAVRVRSALADYLSLVSASSDEQRGATDEEVRDAVQALERD